MANDYLKHYGVPKSQWSAKARAKYDAEHRRKYDQEDRQSIQNGRGAADSNSSFSSSPNSQSQEPKKPGRFAKTAKIGHKSNRILVQPQTSGSFGKTMGTNAIDKRIRDSKVWNSLNPEQKKRAQGLSNLGKTSRKLMGLPFVGGSFFLKRAIKKDEKKIDKVDRLLRNAQNVYDYDAKYRTNRSAKSANDGYASKIIKRTPGRKKAASKKQKNK